MSGITNLLKGLPKSLKSWQDSPVLSETSVLDKVSRLSSVVRNAGKSTVEYKEALSTLEKYKKKYRKNPEVVERITQVLRMTSLPGTWKYTQKMSGKGGAKRKTRRQ
jgi:uncharacterized protein with von Willebrand factor type A (vWA) domain